MTFRKLPAAGMRVGRLFPGGPPSAPVTRYGRADNEQTILATQAAAAQREADTCTCAQPDCHRTALYRVSTKDGRHMGACRQHVEQISSAAGWGIRR